MHPTKKHLKQLVKVLSYENQSYKLCFKEYIRMNSLMSKIFRGVKQLFFCRKLCIYTKKLVLVLIQNGNCLFIFGEVLEKFNLIDFRVNFKWEILEHLMENKLVNLFICEKKVKYLMCIKKWLEKCDFRKYI